MAATSDEARCRYPEMASLAAPMNRMPPEVASSTAATKHSSATTRDGSQPGGRLVRQRERHPSITMATMDVAALTLVGALVLRGVYTTVRTRWPMHYFDIGGPAADGVDPIVSRSMTRYLAFRIAPVFIVATFVVVTSVRWERNEWLAAGLLVSWYLALVAAAAMIDRRHRPSAVGERSVAYWTSSALLVVLASAAAVLLRSAPPGSSPPRTNCWPRSGPQGSQPSLACSSSDR